MKKSSLFFVSFVSLMMIQCALSIKCGFFNLDEGVSVGCCCRCSVRFEAAVVVVVVVVVVVANSELSTPGTTKPKRNRRIFSTRRTNFAA